MDTTETLEFTNEQNSSEITYNHGIHGVMDMCSMLKRCGKPYAILAGHYEESGYIERACGYVRAASIVKALLIAVAVALGTGAAYNLVDAVCGLPQQMGTMNHSPLVTCFVSFVACAGFVIVFNIHGHGNLLCALGGAVTWGAYCLAAAFDCDNYLCCFIATCVAAVFSEMMARVRKYPAISYLVISLLPLIPGAGIYYTALYAIRGNMALASQYGINTLASAGVMAAGIFIVSTAVRMWTAHKNHHM